jgi:hypothetical protein
MARSRTSRPLVWTSLVRLPEDIGAFVDHCAAAELTPPAVLLRRWIAERVDQERSARPAPAPERMWDGRQSD